MGRRKTESTGQDSQPEIKKKKFGSIPANEANIKPELKLRLILGREAIEEKSLSADEVDVDSLDVDDFNDTKTSSNSDETLQDEIVPFNDDDEEAWLDALEKGDLDDYGELKKEKDPTLMTARQRAMKERTSVLSSKSFVNVSLLGATTGTQEMTEEMKKRKEEKNKRRKLQAVKKAEENQKQTIERLVKHQESKPGKERKKKENTNASSTTSLLQKPVAKILPMIKYISRENTITLSYPDDMECPMKAKTGVPRIDQPPCLVCGEMKKYSCSKTGVPLCSLSCYKINLSKVS